MCFGGGPSAESIYQSKKPEFGDLPSLSMTPTKRKGAQMKDVTLKQRKGSKAYSLLNPMGFDDAER